MTKLKSKRAFPWTGKIGGHEITFRLMAPEDGARLLNFTQGLSKDDMMFLRMDISQPEVIEEWVQNVQMGRTITVLAFNEKDDIVGYCSLHTNERLWTRHIGEIRVFVLHEYRGIRLASRLVTEMFQIAREQNLDRITFNIAREQPHMQQMLEGLGFKVEALLTDWLMDRDGRTHDLLIMSHDVKEQ
jgi:L-amino acid N-acyltransferase YncA